MFQSPVGGNEETQEAMLADGYCVDTAVTAVGTANKATKKKKKRRSGNKKKMATPEMVLASKYVREWALKDSIPSSPVDEFLEAQKDRAGDKIVFELHCHSNYSDGFLTPSAVVERAYVNGVKVLALTDHDTMAGISEAMEAAWKFGMRIIPGVEISAMYLPREESATEEPVHILAYYGSCGPSRYEEVENLLLNIRDGRYLRAKVMLSKLNELKMPLKWEHVAKIAGAGVAPGRLHVARALVEAGHVKNLKQAFSRYLYDYGPAYAMGTEPNAEDVVQLICHTGGVAALAHPWALKNPVPVIKNLKAAGLHALEVYRSDGKLSGFSDLADTYELVKLGGSDFHGKRGPEEPDLGSVYFPVQSAYEFLKLAQPIWCNAIKIILSCFAEEPSDMNLEKILRFGKLKHRKGFSTVNFGKDVVDECLSSWLTHEERETAEFEAIRLKVLHTVFHKNGFQLPLMSR